MPARHNAVGLGGTFGFLDCSNTELRQIVVKEIGEVIRCDNENQVRLCFFQLDPYLVHQRLGAKLPRSIGHLVGKHGSMGSSYCSY